MPPAGMSAAELLKLPGEASPSWATFNPSWYLRAYPAVRDLVGDTTPTELLSFYLDVGQRRGHSPNRYFDETRYRVAYPKVVLALQDGTYLSGFDHYCRIGYQTLAPHWLFQVEQYYFDQNPDLTAEILDEAGVVNGYDHFLRWGAHECRIAHPFFDPLVYQAELDPGAAKEAVDAGPFHHFLKCIERGGFELRTSQHFDPTTYLPLYPKVASAIEHGIWRCALHHYLANDTPTRFDPSPEFSEADYLRRYPDIAAAVQRGDYWNGYAHFVIKGMAEGRVGEVTSKLAPVNPETSAGTQTHAAPTEQSSASSEGSQAEAGDPENETPLVVLDAVEQVEPSGEDGPADSDVPPQDEYQGHIDLCTFTRLDGWGVKNGIPAELDVVVNDRAVARIHCDWHRPDLVPHGLPVRAGFRFVFDAPLAPSDKVSVCFAEGPELANSPNGPRMLPITAESSEFLGFLIDLCGLQPDDAVLEVGCGSGRTALSLAGYLNREGRYAGLDVARKAIVWCAENISRSFPNFNFIFTDVRRRTYNPRGKYEHSEFRFPYPDGSFDVVLITSEFTRMLPADMRHYMSEVTRVTKLGGRSLITFFLLNDESVALGKKGNGSIKFEHDLENARTADLDDPESAIAFPENFVKAVYKECGLEIQEPVHYGKWCGRTNGMSGQDVLIAIKAERA